MNIIKYIAELFTGNLCVLGGIWNCILWDHVLTIILFIGQDFEIRSRGISHNNVLFPDAGHQCLC